MVAELADPAARSHLGPSLAAGRGARGAGTRAGAAWRRVARAAAAQGVRVDMPLAEAKSLVPSVAVERHDPAADRQALRRLAAACERFSPCVALEEGDEPESLLLDISNLTHLLGSEAELAAKVERFFAAQRYRVQIAVADTVGLAWAVAHYGERLQIANCRMQIADRQSASGNLQFAPCRSAAHCRTTPSRCSASWASKPSASCCRCRGRVWRRGSASSCCGGSIN